MVVMDKRELTNDQITSDRVRILHTADWHIGKQLHKYSLEEDHRLFFDWLIEYVKSQKINLLLVSGDVFDTAFPSATSLRQYYQFLTSLIAVNCRIVITAGNHDSPAVLNAPSDILSHLNINVVGDVSSFPDRCYVALPESNLAVAAIPFLRDADLRKSVSGMNYTDRLTQIREGISRYYQNILEFHKENYPEFGLIGMGHLHVSGVETSESEREVHVVGNLAAFELNHFPKGYEYIALGHIHKPQKLADRIRYSGSPIPLSFSEREDPKFVVELEFDKGALTSQNLIKIPQWRELRSFAGNLIEVKEQLDKYDPKSILEPFVEVQVTEANYDPQIHLQFEQMLQEYENARFRIIKPRLTFENRLKDAADLFATGVEIEDLSPRQVFLRRLESEEMETEQRELLRTAFDELLGEISIGE